MAISKIRLAALVAIVLLGASGCGPLTDSRKAGEIPVHLSGVNDSVCPMTMSVSNRDWQINYLGVYVSNPEVRIDGRWQALNFQKNDWQTKKVALLKFHGMCEETPEGNTRLLLDASEKLMKLATNLRFTIGLPFEQNHANPLSQPSPLNDSSMFWSWQAGHKFIRLDLTNPDTQHNFSYHLGSIGCESDAPVRPPEKACAFTNRVEMILPMTQLDTELDLSLSVSTMVAQVALPQTEGCKFDPPSEGVCKQLLHNLLHRPWLDWE
ncbi:MbnP family copper-binding protein [Alteromonas halophila]|nr:MbnP family copper-binding protein [Alteromonas halophila]